MNPATIITTHTLKRKASAALDNEQMNKCASYPLDSHAAICNNTKQSLNKGSDLHKEWSRLAVVRTNSYLDWDVGALLEECANKAASVSPSVTDCHVW